MVSHTAKRRREGTDTDQGEVKALRKENEELREERAKSREEIEGLKLTIAKLKAGYQALQEEDEDDEEEVRLPTEAWAIIAEKINKNDVYSFALVSKQLREAQVLAGRELVTRPCRESQYGNLIVTYFTEDWCAYWSKKFIEDHTHPEVIKRVLYVAARCGYLEVFEKYWSQGPQRKLRKLLDKKTCDSAAQGGHLELVKWLRAKGCPWDTWTSSDAAFGGHLEVLRWARSQGCPLDERVPIAAAEGGHLEVLQWMRCQDPPCPWNSDVCYFAAGNGHLEVLRWARSQGCPWNKDVTYTAAEGGQLEVLQWMRSQDPPCPWDSRVCYWAARKGHLEILRWARSQGCPWNEGVPFIAARCGHLKVLKWLIKERCPCSKSRCREAAARGGERARKVLEWLDDETSDTS